MPEALNLKDVVEDIVSSYEKRIESIGSIFDTTNLIFGDLQESIFNTKDERGKISTQLRDTLAKNEHLRRKDFDTMMQGILQSQTEREGEVRRLLKDYINRQKTMAQDLKENLRRLKDSLGGGEAKRVRQSQVLIKDILAEQERRKEEITSKLKEFQKEQHDLGAKLHGLLARGNNLRIKDFKLMLREFKAQREGRLAVRIKRKEEVNRMLNGFKKARQETRSLPRAVNIDAQKEQKG